ncbi:MAG: hypothetical protein DRR00_05750 [Candidatus Parabeggiatoa sp. nov. 3]|nr:MAG: hypothetical protein DRR00_05750 [Gammaproteobacteria bacterium]RKZ68032.1 MAG: hypothetical protein DRQ99_04945 [Gammaproteobacteria bacterium]
MSLQNYFAKAFFVPNLFCEGPFRSKFILRRPFSFQIYFAKAFFVPNLFCEGLFRSKFILRRPFSFYFVLHAIGKRYSRTQFILRGLWNACYFAKALECLLFCEGFGMPVILRGLWNACYFARVRLKYTRPLYSSEIDNNPFFGNAPFKTNYESR